MAPEYTLDCLEWLKGKDLSSFSVFEFGAGDSTNWWRYYVKQVDTVEMDLKKSRQFGAMWNIGPVNYLYSIFSKNKEKYDLVIINGDLRDQCTSMALQKIKKGGYIIINNFHQDSAGFPVKYWADTNDLLAHYPQVVFHEKGHEDFKTSIWQIVR